MNVQAGSYRRDAVHTLRFATLYCLRLNAHGRACASARRDASMLRSMRIEEHSWHVDGVRAERAECAQSVQSVRAECARKVCVECKGDAAIDDATTISHCIDVLTQQHSRTLRRRAERTCRERNALAQRPKDVNCTPEKGCNAKPHASRMQAEGE